MIHKNHTAINPNWQTYRLKLQCFFLFWPDVENLTQEGIMMKAGSAAASPVPAPTHTPIHHPPPSPSTATIPTSGFGYPP